MTILKTFRLKKPNHNLYYRRRHGLGQNLTADQQVNVLRSRKVILALLLFEAIDGSDEELDTIINLAIARHLCLSYVEDIALSPCVDKKRTIESFGIEIKKDFRFEAMELRLLLAELKFPETVRFDNRIRMSGEEVFLRGLYELSSGEVKHKVADEFGRDLSVQTRAFYYFIDHIYDNFHHLVHDNLDWWYRNGFWERSANAIGIKMNERNPSNVRNKVSHFVDCNCLEGEVPGGGPNEAGANARRWDDLIQRAFYNGWKSIHGMKHQTIDNAYGMTEDMYGPTSLRRNDLVLLRRSEINERFEALQAGKEFQFIIFGDSAYKVKSHMTSYIKLAAFKRWNAAMKHVRISIEWNYGTTSSLFSYVCMKHKFKLLQNSRVSKIYTVATLFRNFHVAAYGGQSSRYFELSMPKDMLVKYIRQEDF